MLVALIAIPLLMALVALAIPSDRARPWVLPVAGAAHLGLSFRLLGASHMSAWNGWLALDPLNKVFLPFVSVLFFLCSVYAVGYLTLRADHKNRVFCACLLALLSMMTLEMLAHHLGLMWVALETCTLSSAPLLYFHRSTRSLEELWKYLLIGSVGRRSGARIVIGGGTGYPRAIDRGAAPGRGPSRRARYRRCRR